MPEISIVIPLYNKGRYIARALDAVLVQTVRDYEIIVIDDGSTDKGAEVVKGFSDHRLHLIQQTNAGVSVARNRGIEAASAKLIAFLDADDYWKPDYLKTIMRLHNSYPQAGLYATAYEVKMAGGMTFIPTFKGIPKAPWEGIIRDYFEAALGNPSVCASAVAVRRSVFETVGFFPPGENRGEDSDMWARIAFDYPIAFSNSFSAIYCCDADNRLCSIPSVRSEPVVLRTMRKALQSRHIPEKRRYYMEEYMYSVMLGAAKVFAEIDDMAVARTILRECRTKYFLRKKLLLLTFCFLPKTMRHGLIMLNRLLKEIILYRLADYFLWKKRRTRAGGI
jgi:Glycosyltransferases involved in cell wall biogenesis